MSKHIDALRRALSSGPTSARQLGKDLAVSQPTISRALAELGSERVSIGAARSIHYALRDGTRGLPDMPVYRVDTAGRVCLLGRLIPVRPEGFVMRQEDGVALHTEGLPWWLLDMRPQGFLGRAYAARHGAELGLPTQLQHWSDTHALRALLVHGHDGVGNVLLGDLARDRFLAAPVPEPLADDGKLQAYVRLAREAADGEAPGSSAGGEQPKFTAYAKTERGDRHVLVKFTEALDSPVSERWRDLLEAEHLALATLREAGVSAAASAILDHGGQRFLEVVRFDRVDTLGRRGLISLAALDAEFVGSGGGWPGLCHRLAESRTIDRQAAEDASLLWAYGTLIGNTDMHSGNLSFVTEQGRPYALAPAYDMTCMAFAPRNSGALPTTLAEAMLHADVPHATWQRAERLAGAFLDSIQAAGRFSPRFAPCIDALAGHLATARRKIARMG
ncbi:serine/threonine protein kinase HipA of HipAB toxin-antitoxin module [Comamonas sp. BIGb0124]|uniref:type II toxin-antitoxin system HipA family toxin YjjJ n=1 Tax=Comamonas sp. BIGb0124 TaxID=2485130 RepID=UPI000F4998C5|nr:type II toxin-antitoxin system HipA family toxin YjjJ [Comamonas sp. BIGb0124]ROR24444.1 serine/threonine protein kinase HipA of HipAB toxin-antitoxin module [Comamonas sp. BIGb0124]